MLRRRVLIAAAVAAAAIIGYWWWTGNRGEGPQERERPTVTGETFVATVGEVPRVVEGTGVVVSAREAVLAGKVLAAVKTINAREGARVAAGDVLITLDDRELVADVERAEAERRNAQSRLERLRSVGAEGLVAPQTLEDAERSLRVADAARESAAALLASAVIRAPFHGVVTDRYIEVGDMATPGKPLLKLEDSRDLRLEVTVAGDEASLIQARQPVEAVIDALGPQPLAGTVAVVVPRAEAATQSITVKIDLPRAPGLQGGLYGRARFAVGRDSALTVPRSAVSSVGALDRVYVAGADHVLRARLVRLGRAYGDRVEVRAGLEPGERVLADGSRGVDGARFGGAPGP
ncbi:MAG TPA: efflux RND transporter periplasmic adaptor subunit [Nitrospiria bacterium]|nr:efflux RND transporter periplasmic adaptor subunit [Nitrospiria bacterium]